MALPRSTRWVATTLAGALLLTACGGDEAATPATPTTAATSASPSPAPEASSATSDAEVPAATFDATPFEGTWTGSWTNTTFQSTGSVEVVVEQSTDAGAVTVVVDLGGNVFGAQDPPAETITIDLADLRPDGAEGLVLETERFGPVVVSFNLMSLAFSGTAAAIPDDGIDAASFELSINDSGATGTYTVTFSDANTAEGTIELTRA